VAFVLGSDLSGGDTRGSSDATRVRWQGTSWL